MTPTDKFALSEELEVGPEDVAGVVGDELDEGGVGQLTQLFARDVEVVQTHALQVKLLDRPLNPVLHMHVTPQKRIWWKIKQ